MHNEHTTPRYPVETGQRSHRHAAAIHEVHGFLQSKFLPCKGAAGNFALVFALGPELRAALACHFIYKPEPGVMPGLFVFCPGITQPGNELYGSQRTAAA